MELPPLQPRRVLPLLQVGHVRVPAYGVRFLQRLQVTRRVASCLTPFLRHRSEWCNTHKAVNSKLRSYINHLPDHNNAPRAGVCVCFRMLHDVLLCFCVSVFWTFVCKNREIDKDGDFFAPRLAPPPPPLPAHAVKVPSILGVPRQHPPRITLSLD